MVTRADKYNDSDGLFGLYSGKVVKRELDPIGDPECAAMEVRGRVRIEIPGMFAETPWAYPKGSGGYRYGKNESPPLGTDVFVQFINGDPDQPVYELADPAPDETFPEFVHPDVFVWGDDQFRFIRDRRADQDYATFQVVKEINGAEEAICELRFDVKGNSLRIYATTALEILADGFIKIGDGRSDVEINGRKVMPVKRVM